jgi:hypothetical protein
MKPPLVDPIKRAGGFQIKAWGQADGSDHWSHQIPIWASDTHLAFLSPELGVRVLRGTDGACWGLLMVVLGEAGCRGAHTP